MTDREADDDWVAPVSQLFGGPAVRSRSLMDDSVDLAPKTAAAEADERPVAPRRLPTFADFDRESSPRPKLEGVVNAGDRFAARRRAHDPDGSSMTDAAGAVDDQPRRRIENVSTAALARRGMSESELRTRLTEKGYTDEQVEPEIQRLLAAGYLDDRKLAEEIIRVEAERKGKGRSAIVAELKRRGVGADSFTDALDEMDADDEFDRAQELVRRKLSSLRNVDDEAARRRLYGALSRRGFGGDIVRSVVDQAMVDRP